MTFRTMNINIQSHPNLLVPMHVQLLMSQADVFGLIEQLRRVYFEVDCYCNMSF